MKPLLFSLYTPEKHLIDKVPIKEIVVPSVKGELGILPQHACLISLLQAGVLKYWKTESKTCEKIAVSWGYLEVADEEVKVLAESAEVKENLDKNQIEEDIKKINKELEAEDLIPQKRRELEKKRDEILAKRDLLSK